MKTEVSLITPEIALEILKTNKRNRPMKKDLVLFYAEEMKKGSWKLNGESIIISSTNILLDGQHRLAAIVKSGIEQQMVVVTGAKNEVFDTIDVGKTRTSGDIMAIDGISNANKHAAGIGKYFFIKKGSAFSQRTQGLRSNGLSKSSILKFYLENSYSLDEIQNFSTKCNDKFRLFTTSEIYAICAFLILDKKREKETVFSFFRQLLKIDTVENETLNYAYDKLLSHKIGSYKMTRAFRDIFIIKIWNYFIMGKEVSFIRVSPESDKNIQFI